MSLNPQKIFGFARTAAKSRYGTRLDELLPPIVVMIARTSRFVNSSLISAARSRGVPDRAPCEVARAVRLPSITRKPSRVSSATPWRYFARNATWAGNDGVQMPIVSPGRSAAGRVRLLIAVIMSQL